MSSFRFGSLDIEASAYGSQGGAVLGIRDSGKTYTATLLAERLFAAGIPFTAFDPIGVWRFLRVPGKGAGIPVVVAGGTDGDLALTPNTAPAIVEAAMQNGISLVIDLFSLELSKADWRRIVRDSVRLMLHKNSRHGLRHVFIEEAAEFAPQRIIDGGDVYAEIEKLARMGGNSRLGYTLINQRAEEINHDNGLRDDNRPSNLLCGTSGINAEHAQRNGLLDQHGQRNPAAKLTDNEVAQIRLAYAKGGYTMKRLAERFGVREQHISRLVRGQRRPKQGGPTLDADQRHNACDRDPASGRFVGSAPT